jgi:outer membrane receptor protein involved in Fe transport
VALAASVHAQQAVMDEIIVTAQKRPEPLNHVPLSVAVVSGDKMMDAGIFDLGDLSIYIPNFQRSPTPVGSYLVIRGIGSGVNQGFEQSVMMYVDDIALGRGRLAQTPFLDLQRIEVLRGPQNVLFGRNSLAGALSLVTNKPSPDFEGMVLAEYEPKYITRHGQLVLNGPLTDELRGRLALRYYDEDGYFDNNLNGEEEARREDSTWRGTLAWDVSDAVDATLKISQTSADTHGAPSEMVFGYANPIEGDLNFGLNYPETAQVIGALVGYDIGSDDGRQNFRRNTNHDEVIKLDIDNVTLTANWVAEHYTLTSITGYVAYDVDMFLDLDGLGVDFIFSEEKENYDQFSQELRFTSSGEGGNEWIAGLYYQEWDLHASIDVSAADESLLPALADLGVFDPLPPDLFAGYLTRRDYNVDNKSLAAFAESTWSISPFTRITLGGRYTVDEKDGVRRIKKFDLPIERVDANRDEDYFTGTAIVEWDVGDDSMLYASVANGYKAGGFDARSVRPGDFEYKDESVPPPTWISSSTNLRTAHVSHFTPF